MNISEYSVHDEYSDANQPSDVLLEVASNLVSPIMTTVDANVLVSIVPGPIVTDTDAEAILGDIGIDPELEEEFMQFEAASDEDLYRFEMRLD